MPRRLTASAAVIALALSAAAMAQNATPDTSSRGSTEVVVRGIPRLRPALGDPLPPLDIFVKPARIEQIALSPDGSVIAFTTHVEGQHLMAIYKVGDGSKRAIKLGDDPLTAITFMDNDHILLSASQTGLRGTCPAVAGQGKADNDTKMSLIQGGGSTTDGGAAAAGTLALLNALRTPGCAYYGVRSEEAVTVFNLKTDTGTRIGDHMSELNNLALGIPKTVMVDGKPKLMGPFLELRLDSINRQPLQRVYLWQTDPETGRGKLIDDGGGDLDRESRYVDDWLFDNHGQLIARTVYSFRTETFFIEIKTDEAKGKKWRPIYSQKVEARIPNPAPVLAGVGRDGASIVVFDRDAASGQYHYYELSSDGQRSGPLEPDNALHDRPIFHPATGRLAGFVSEGAAPVYQLSDPTLARIYEAGQDSAQGQSVRIAATAQDPRHMIVFTQGGNDAGNYYYLDLTQGTFVDLGNDHAAVPAEWVATQSAISYPSGDGYDIQALLTVPSRPEAKNLPLVVLPHDGPQGYDAQGYNWLAQVLASRGYLVLQPNYRGSDGNGAIFRAAGDGEWSAKIPADLDAGVRDLVARGTADPNRVCIVGIGYGGYLALNGAVSGKTYRCAAAINGISDVADYATWARINRPVLDPDILGGLETDPDWPGAFKPAGRSYTTLLRYIGSADGAAISPVNKATDATPVLLVRSKNDRLVPGEQSRHMSEALKKAGKAVEYTELDGCDHDLSTEACRLATAETVVAFLATYNPVK